jgi:hypothetical protein
MAEFRARANGMRMLSTSWNRNTIVNSEADWSPWSKQEGQSSDPPANTITFSRYSFSNPSTTSRVLYNAIQKGGSYNFNRLDYNLTEGEFDKDSNPEWISAETYEGNLSGDPSASKYGGSVTRMSREERSLGAVNNSWVATGTWELDELQSAQTTSSEYHTVLTASSDRFIGNDFVDTMNAGLENDILTGNGGDDYMIGGAGDDIIDGGTGDDQLFDSIGINQLTGGPGADRFYAWSTSGNARWTQNKPEVFWVTRKVSVGSKGSKKTTEYLFDPNVDIIQDFNIDEDLLYISGRSRFVVKSDGVEIWDGKRNVTAFLAGINDYQFLHQVRELPW